MITLRTGGKVTVLESFVFSLLRGLHTGRPGQLLSLAVAKPLSPESELPPAPPPARAFLAAGPGQVRRPVELVATVAA